MTAAQIRNSALITLMFGVQLLTVTLAFVFAVYPVMDAHGWVDRPELRITVEHTATSEATP